MESQPIRALLVEDNPGDARLIQALLEEVAINGNSCVLERADRLTAGLERLSRGGIDVVLLDLSLPESSGLDTFHAAHAKAPRTPTIVLTGLNDEEMAVRAVQEGAEDYLVKGQVDGHLLLRSMRYAIERSRRRGLEEKLRATEAEFQVAQQIQRGLYPDAAPAVPGLDIAGASFPAEAVGGDYYDYFPIAGGALGVVVADAVGHGVGPALLVAEARACLRTLALTHDDLSSILTLTNRVMVEGLQEDRFVTLLLAKIDSAGSLVYASAGHPTGYVLDESGSVRVKLESTSFPLGVFADVEFPSGPPVPLRAGDSVFLLTDGVIEARPPLSKELFGDRRALDVVRQHRQACAKDVVQALYEAVRDYSRHTAPVDDITAIVMKVGPEFKGASMRAPASAPAGAGAAAARTTSIESEAPA